MPVDAIGPRQAPLPIYDPWSPIDPIREVRREEPATNKDSLKKVKDSANAWAFISPEIAGNLALHPFQETHANRPKLENPQFDLQKQKFPNDFEHLIPKVDSSENSSQEAKEQLLNEAVLFALYISCMQAQIGFRETETLLANEIVQQRQQQNQAVMEEYFKLKDDIISRSKTSETLGWVNWALWGGLAVAGAASIAATVMTAGAALPTVLVVANAALGVSSGATQITKGVVDYQNNNAVGSLKEKEFERYLNTEKIQNGVEEMKKSAEVIAQCWDQAIEVAQNQYAASIDR